jgi:hypothetical protein
MSLAAREYVCLDGLGNYDECARIQSAAYFALEKIYDQKLIVGYKLQIYQDEGSLFVDGIDSDEIKETTKADPPLLWLNVNYDSENYGQEELLEFSRAFNFHEMYDYDSGKPVSQNS